MPYILMDTFCIAYRVSLRQSHGNHYSGESFDERTDWEPVQKSRRVINANHFVAIGSVLLVAGLTYLAQ
jgi:hypothetical protein